MVVLNDALGQRQPKSPATFFAGVTRIKNALKLRFGDAFACIRKIDGNMIVFFADVNRKMPDISHGIHSIFSNIFDNPLKKMKVDGH